MATAGNNDPNTTSRLFLVRIWGDAMQQDGTDGNKVDANFGKIVNVLTGEAHYFDKWSDLIGLIEQLSSPNLSRSGAHLTHAPKSLGNAPDSVPID